MYTTIINPKTGRKVSIYGKIGQEVLKNYRYQLGGKCDGPDKINASDLFDLDNGGIREDYFNVVTELSDELNEEILLDNNRLIYPLYTAIYKCFDILGLNDDVEIPKKTHSAEPYDVIELSELLADILEDLIRACDMIPEDFRQIWSILLPFLQKLFPNKHYMKM
tara:strand:- start:3195 stop:3689 length:495 start_codon:yes stop_codon:yes gene_type:complete